MFYGIYHIYSGTLHIKLFMPYITQASSIITLSNMIFYTTLWQLRCMDYFVHVPSQWKWYLKMKPRPLHITNNGSNYFYLPYLQFSLLVKGRPWYQVNHNRDAAWVLWHLKSPVTQEFVTSLFKLTQKKTQNLNSALVVNCWGIYWGCFKNNYSSWI